MQTQSQTALMAPGGDMTALRDLFADMLTRRENVQLITDRLNCKPTGQRPRYRPPSNRGRTRGVGRGLGE
jgi:hypothetical protein